MVRVPSGLRGRAGVVFAIALLLTSVVPARAVETGTTAPVATTSPADLTPAGAISAMVDAINRDRSAAGLVPFQPDPRLMTLAGERAAQMASSGDFSHTAPNGQTVFEMIDAAGIAWYGAAEAIAWNDWPTLAASVGEANGGWMGSDVHRPLLLATDDNYVGVGLATAADGTHYWAAVFIREPDRTGPKARLAPPATTRLSTGTFVHLAWTGADVQLQALTSGLRDFQLQRRTDGGAWIGVASATTARTWTLPVAGGHVYAYRVRARDRAGNYGAWTTPVSVAIAA